MKARTYLSWKWILVGFSAIAYAMPTILTVKGISFDTQRKKVNVSYGISHNDKHNVDITDNGPILLCALNRLLRGKYSYYLSLEGSKEISPDDLALIQKSAKLLPEKERNELVSRVEKYKQEKSTDNADQIFNTLVSVIHTTLTPLKMEVVESNWTDSDQTIKDRAQIEKMNRTLAVLKDGTSDEEKNLAAKYVRDIAALEAKIKSAKLEQKTATYYESPVDYKFCINDESSRSRTGIDNNATSIAKLMADLNNTLDQLGGISVAADTSTQQPKPTSENPSGARQARPTNQPTHGSDEKTGVTSRPGSTVTKIPSGARPQEAAVSLTDRLTDKMCANGTENSAHFDCAQTKKAVDTFMQTSQGALKNTEPQASFGAISNAIQGLLQSEEGVKPTVAGNACSENNTGKDILKRNGDAILDQLIQEKEVNSKIKAVAQIEKLNTIDLLQMPENIKQEEQDIRKAVLDNRIAMYGKILSLPDDTTKQFLSSFSKAMKEAEENSIQAKEAGKILAKYLDSMSSSQKQALSHFANSFASSSVDKDFRQAVQLAINNWSQNLKDKKAGESADQCFVSSNKHFENVKAGFIEAMGKDVKANRDAFWSTIDAANGEDADKKSQAKDFLKRKWGKTLPAYMESLQKMSETAANADDKKFAKDRLDRIKSALSEEKLDLTQDLRNQSLITTAKPETEAKAEVKAEPKAEVKPEAKEEVTTEAKPDPEPVPVGEVEEDKPEATKEEGFDSAALAAMEAAIRPVKIKDAEKYFQLAYAHFLKAATNEDLDKVAAELVAKNPGLNEFLSKAELRQLTQKALQLAKDKKQKTEPSADNIKIETLPAIPKPKLQPTSIARIGVPNIQAIQEQLNQSIQADMQRHLLNRKVQSPTLPTRLPRRPLAEAKIEVEQIPIEIPKIAPVEDKKPELKPAEITIQRRAPELPKRPGFDMPQGSKKQPLEISGHAGEIPSPLNGADPVL